MKISIIECNDDDEKLKNFLSPLVKSSIRCEIWGFRFGDEILIRRMTR